MTLTEPVNVAAIREALKVATPGPWEVIDEHALGVSVYSIGQGGFWLGIDLGKGDAELVVLVRNNIDALLGELEELRWLVRVGRAVEQGELSYTPTPLLANVFDDEHEVVDD